jgi:hypothetical protein
MIIFHIKKVYFTKLSFAFSARGGFARNNLRSLAMQSDPSSQAAPPIKEMDEMMILDQDGNPLTKGAMKKLQKEKEKAAKKVASHMTLLLT